MTALVASELLKLRTTRARFVYPLVVLALVGLGTAATIGTATAFERASAEFQHDLVAGAGIAGFIAFIVGIVVVTGEFRHGTITPTLLVVPERARVLAAKAATMAAIGLLLGVAGLALVGAIAAPWLSAADVELHLTDGEALERAARVLLSSLLWGLLGVAVGALVQSQVAALVGSIVWLLMVEPLAGALLELVGVEGAGPYFHGQSLDAVAGLEGDLLSLGEGLGLALVYLVAIGGIGYVRLRERDIT